MLHNIISRTTECTEVSTVYINVTSWTFKAENGKPSHWMSTVTIKSAFIFLKVTWQPFPKRRFKRYVSVVWQTHKPNLAKSTTNTYYMHVFSFPNAFVFSVFSVNILNCHGVAWLTSEQHRWCECLVIFPSICNMLCYKTLDKTGVLHNYSCDYFSVCLPWLTERGIGRGSTQIFYVSKIHIPHCAVKMNLK